MVDSAVALCSESHGVDVAPGIVASDPNDVMRVARYSTLSELDPSLQHQV